MVLNNRSEKLKTLLGEDFDIVERWALEELAPAPFLWLTNSHLLVVSVLLHVRDATVVRLDQVDSVRSAGYDIVVNLHDGSKRRFTLQHASSTRHSDQRAIDEARHAAELIEHAAKTHTVGVSQTIPSQRVSAPNVPPPPAPPATSHGQWIPDPIGRFQLRWMTADGHVTEHVIEDGEPQVCPIPRADLPIGRPGAPTLDVDTLTRLLRGRFGHLEEPERLEQVHDLLLTLADAGYTDPQSVSTLMSAAAGSSPTTQIAATFACLRHVEGIDIMRRVVARQTRRRDEAIAENADAWFQQLIHDVEAKVASVKEDTMAGIRYPAAVAAALIEGTRQDAEIHLAGSIVGDLTLAAPIQTKLDLCGDRGSGRPVLIGSLTVTGSIRHYLEIGGDVTGDVTITNEDIGFVTLYGRIGGNLRIVGRARNVNLDPVVAGSTDVSGVEIRQNW